MTFQEYELAFSRPRLDRFLLAVQGNQENAVELYRQNILLSDCLFGVLSIFEITLRNHIDRHYKVQFADNEWLKSLCGQGGMFSHHSFSKYGFESRTKILTIISQLGKRYNHDRLVSELSLGFWTYMFAPIQFRVGGQRLHHIYINRPRGTTQSQLFNELDEIRNLRNRIAHHEPLCFDLQHNLTTFETWRVYKIILKHIEWLGYEASKLLMGLDETEKFLQTINAVL